MANTSICNAYTQIGGLYSFNCMAKKRNATKLFCLSQQNHRADGDGRLAALLDPSFATPERSLARVDGWILGVA
jgi:hypothetical protein